MLDKLTEMGRDRSVSVVQRLSNCGPPSGGAAALLGGGGIFILNEIWVHFSSQKLLRKATAHVGLWSQ
jgi:hypothetical protein